jgi:hypothetical protein
MNAYDQSLSPFGPYYGCAAEIDPLAACETKFGVAYLMAGLPGQTEFAWPGPQALGMDLDHLLVESDAARFAELLGEIGGVRDENQVVLRGKTADQVRRGASPCLGGVIGWSWVRRDVVLSPRLAGCRGAFANRTLDATTDTLALDLRVAKAWELTGVTLDLGITLGGELLQERFETRGLAPTRTSLAAHVDAGGGLAVPLRDRLYLAAELAAQTHFLSIQDADGRSGPTARFAVRGLVVLGAWL